MKLGLLGGYSGRKISIPIDQIRHAESLGYDSFWTSEAYGSDAVSPAAWILAQTEKLKVGTAIMQMPARSPAMTLAELSGGRFMLGLGGSGPQVVEGWHGVPYGKPVTRLREYIRIVKQIVAREAPATFEGDQYQLPYGGPWLAGVGYCRRGEPSLSSTSSGERSGAANGSTTRTPSKSCPACRSSVRRTGHALTWAAATMSASHHERRKRSSITQARRSNPVSIPTGRQRNRSSTTSRASRGLRST